MNTFFAQSANLLPLIKRARAFHLYSESRRYLDLFLCRASAVLGHRCRGYSTVMKNVIEQSMYMPYPNIWHQRLLSALKKIFPDYKSAIFLSSQDIPWTESWDESPSDYVLWRPMMPAPQARFIMPVLPLPIQPCTIVLTKSESPAENCPHLPIPAVWARLLLRAVQFWPKAQALPVMPPYWQRLFEKNTRVHGRYFFSHLPEDKHALWYRYALEKGIILPPAPRMAGMLPTEMSSGEKKLLQEVLQWT